MCVLYSRIPIDPEDKFVVGSVPNPLPRIDTVIWDAIYFIMCSLTSYTWQEVAQFLSTFSFFHLFCITNLIVWAGIELILTFVSLFNKKQSMSYVLGKIRCHLAYIQKVCMPQISKLATYKNFLKKFL